MDDRTYRGLLVAGICANVPFVMLALLDYSLNASQYMWPIFVGWAFLLLLITIVAVAGSNVRLARVVPQEVRAVEREAPKAVAAPANIVQAAAKEAFPFTYNGYTLHSRETTLKGGGRQLIYFFAKGKPKSGTPAAKPATHHVGVNERTGLPFLKRGTGADGEDLTPAKPDAYRPQCSALTDEGHQCRNSAREASKYCASHFGYQPPAIAKAAARREDTRPRVRGAPDTVPSVRRRAA